MFPTQTYRSRIFSFSISAVSSSSIVSTRYELVHQLLLSFLTLNLLVNLINKKNYLYRTPDSSEYLGDPNNGHLNTGYFHNKLFGVQFSNGLAVLCSNAFQNLAICHLNNFSPLKSGLVWHLYPHCSLIFWSWTSVQ